MYRILNTPTRVLFFVVVSLLTYSCNTEPTVFDREYNSRIEHIFSSATLLLDTGSATKVVHYLDSSLNNELAIRIDHKAKKYKLLAELFTYNKTDLPRALKYIDTLSEIAATPFDRDNELKILCGMLRGRIYVYLGDYDEAFRNYYQGKLLVDKSPKKCVGSIYNNSLAYLFFEDGSYREALDYYKLSFEQGAFCNVQDFSLSFSQRQLALNNAGLCYERMHILDSSLMYYQHGLDFIEKNEVRFLPDKYFPILKQKGVLLGNMGGVLLKLRRFEEARVKLEESIKINYNPVSEKYDAILTRIKLADLYLQTGNIISCGNLIDAIRKDLETYPRSTAEYRFADLLYRYYKATNKPVLAMESLEAKSRLADSINLSKFGDRKSMLLAQFQNMKSTLELELLQKENSSKSGYLLLAIIISLLGITITILLLLQRLQHKRHIVKLEELNQAINISNSNLVQSMESLEKRQQENTRMMKIVAHDLRSPISGILGMVELLKSNTLTPEEIANGLNLVEKSGKDAINFINDILHLNIDSSSLNLKETNLAELIESCVQLHYSAFSNKGLNTSVSTFPIKIKIDREKMWRVFNNLLSNAIKFSNPNASIHVSMKNTGNAVLITIKDQGIGIPDHLKDKLFGMFSGAGRPGTDGEQSFGLGLSITKQIITSHHGKIWFESTQGVGTTFFIELPLKSVD